MKVTVDPAIAKTPTLLDRVRRANDYLEARLGPFQEGAEVEWALRPAAERITLRARFTDDPPGEASDTFDTAVLDRDHTTALWVRGVINTLLGERVSLLLGRVRGMLDELESEPEAAAKGVEACPSPR